MSKKSRKGKGSRPKAVNSNKINVLPQIQRIVKFEKRCLNDGNIEEISKESVWEKTTNEYLSSIY